MIARLIRRLFSTTGGSALRGFVRSAVLVLTAFGLDLTPEQILAVHAFVEAALVLGQRLIADPLPPPPPPTT